MSDDMGKTRRELAEEYATGKARAHYDYLFEQHAGTPQDFAKLCYLDGFDAGFRAAGHMWINSLSLRKKIEESYQFPSSDSK